LSSKVYSVRSTTIGRSDSPEAPIENAAMVSSGCAGKSISG
jgi:hypothetical protein